MAICENCKAEIKDGASFCPECGTKLDQTIFCTECGNMTSTKFKFCDACGKPLNADIENGANAQNQTGADTNPVASSQVGGSGNHAKKTASSQSKSKTFILGGAGIGAVAIILAIVLIVSASGPTATLSKFEKSFNNLNINGMIDCFEPAAANAMYAGLNIFENYTNLNPQDALYILYYLGVKIAIDVDSSFSEPTMKIEVLNTNTQGDSATLSTSVNITCGAQSYDDQFLVYMTKVDGDWYIQSIK